MENNDAGTLRAGLLLVGGRLIKALISLYDNVWPWLFILSSSAALQTGIARNWKRDLYYLYSYDSADLEERERENILSVWDDSSQPIRPEWLLSPDIIAISPFICVNIKECVPTWGEQRWKISQKETKGRGRRVRERWGKLIGFAKSSSNSRSQCGFTKRPLPAINLNLFYPFRGNQLSNLIWPFWFTA